MITRARRSAEKGDYVVKFGFLEHYIERCLCLWINSKPPFEKQHQQLSALKEVFPERLWIGYQRELRLEDYQHYLNCLELAKALDLPITAQNNVLMHCKQRLKLQHCLQAIKLNKTVQSLGTELIANAEQSLRPLDSLNKLYPEKLLAENNKHCQALSFFSG